MTLPFFFFLTLENVLSIKELRREHCQHRTAPKSVGAAFFLSSNEDGPNPGGQKLTRILNSIIRCNRFHIVSHDETDDSGQVKLR